MIPKGGRRKKKTGDGSHPMLLAKTTSTSEEKQSTRLVMRKVSEVPASDDLEKSTIMESVIASSTISKVVLTPSFE